MGIIKSIIMSLIVLVVAFSVAFAFTWEGELDPNDFDNWKIYDTAPSSEGFLWMFIRNPDRTSPIEKVAILVNINRIVIIYSYFKYGKPYLFIYDGQQDKYVRRKPKGEKKSSDCSKCHQGTDLIT